MHVLIVDDQPAVREALELLLDLHGIPTLLAASPAEALELIGEREVAVVVQDMNFGENNTSGNEGVALFRALRAASPGVPVLLMTAWTSLETAVELVREGASDYLAKPWDDQKLIARVRALLEERARSGQPAPRDRRRAEPTGRHELCGLVYASSAMHELVTLALQVARGDVPVLITGPNGSGKEKIAEIVQANSRRASRPFLRVNAGALPDSLAEAELFGVEAGAYTGAQKTRVGRFEAADGGTLFLDEIGNLSLAGQMKLLRVLQSGELERLGSNVTRKVDVRVVSATNADLDQAIAHGSFREDLFFRLNVIELRVPPLRERLDDVLPLASAFLASPGEGAGASLSEAARSSLLAYRWPGNVRELQNRIQRARLLCQGGVITPHDLGLDAHEAEPRPRPPQVVPQGTAPPAAASGREGTGAGADDPERTAIEEALVRAGGMVSKAAAELGLSRQALYRKMARHGLAIERRPKG